MASPIYGRKIYVRHGGGEMRNKLVDILSKFGALIFAEPTTNDGIFLNGIQFNFEQFKFTIIVLLCVL